MLCALSGKRKTLTCSSDAGCSQGTWSDRLPWWPCECTKPHTPPYCWREKDILKKRLALDAFLRSNDILKHQISGIFERSFLLFQLLECSLFNPLTPAVTNMQQTVWHSQPAVILCWWHESGHNFCYWIPAVADLYK